jgi:hypothetical protein
MSQGLSKSTRNKQVVCMAGVLCIAVAALATPITYTFSASGNGGLGSQSFSNTFFEITATADTSGISVPSTGIFSVNDLTASVFVTGLGTGTFTIGTINVDNNNLSRVGFSAPAQGLAILFVDNPAFATYDLSSSIGPLSGPGVFNSGAQFNTSMGYFSLTQVSTATFEATLVPEPCALGIWVIGAAALVGRRRFCAAPSLHS